MSTAEDCDDVVKISQVSVGTEVFTPNYTVHSARLGYLADKEQNVVSCSAVRSKPDIDRTFS